MSRRQQLAFTLQRWELHRAGAAYMLRMILAQRLMPNDMRFVTLQLWAEYQSVKLAYLERLAREIEDDRGPRVEVPVEYLSRYL